MKRDVIRFALDAALEYWLLVHEPQTVDHVCCPACAWDDKEGWTCDCLN